MNKKICFVVNNIKSGGTILRALQIKTELNKIYKKLDIIIVDKNNVTKLYNITNSIFFWIAPIIDIHYNKIHKSNKHVLDIIDNYIYHKTKVLNSMKFSSCIIVNSNYMLTYFRNKLKYHGHIYIIYHQWDPRLKNTITIPKDSVVFGYMGSVKSLLHSNNFLHYKKLINKYNIKFYDTECGKDVTNFVYKNNYSFKKPGVFNTNNLPKSVNFNCDINIREYGTVISKFKTTAKIATAAAVGHNIITTIDMAVLDILPKDYPFILKKTDYDSVVKMMDLVIKDFNGNKKLWNKGLNIMKKVKDNLRIERIMLNYLKIINL